MIRYLCGVDYQHEREMNLAHYYDSLEEIKQKSECWQECGIVKLETDNQDKELSHEWVVEQDLPRIKK